MRKVLLLMVSIFFLIQCQEKKNIHSEKIVKTKYKIELIRTIGDTSKIYVNNFGYIILDNRGVKMDSLLVEENKSFDFDEFKMLYSCSNIYDFQEEKLLKKLDYIKNKNHNFVLFACSDLSFNVPCYKVFSNKLEEIEFDRGNKSDLIFIDEDKFITFSDKLYEPSSYKTSKILFFNIINKSGDFETIKQKKIYDDKFESLFFSTKEIIFSDFKSAIELAN